MADRFIENEVFAFRDGDKFDLRTECPPAGFAESLGGMLLAIRIVEIPELPEGEFEQVTEKGETVLNQAIVACQMVRGKWRWVHMSPPTKGAMHASLNHCRKPNTWYYLLVLPSR